MAEEEYDSGDVIPLANFLPLKKNRDVTRKYSAPGKWTDTFAKQNSPWNIYVTLPHICLKDLYASQSDKINFGLKCDQFYVFLVMSCIRNSTVLGVMN